MFLNVAVPCVILPVSQPMAADVTPTQLYKISDRPGRGVGVLDEEQFEDVSEEIRRDGICSRVCLDGEAIRESQDDGRYFLRWECRSESERGSLFAN